MRKPTGRPIELNRDSCLFTIHVLILSFDHGISVNRRPEGGREVRPSGFILGKCERRATWGRRHGNISAKGILAERETESRDMTVVARLSGRWPRSLKVPTPCERCPSDKRYDEGYRFSIRPRNSCGVCDGTRFAARNGPWPWPVSPKTDETSKHWLIVESRFLSQVYMTTSFSFRLILYRRWYNLSDNSIP